LQTMKEYSYQQTCLCPTASKNEKGMLLALITRIILCPKKLIANKLKEQKQRPERDF